MKWEEFIEKMRDLGITLPKIESWNYLPIEEGYKVYRDILCNLLEDIPAIKNDTFLSIYIFINILYVVKSYRNLDFHI